MAAGLSFDHFLINFAAKIEKSEMKFQVLKPNEIEGLNDLNIEDDTIKAYGLPHNVICIKHLFSEQEQIDLVELCNELYPSSLVDTLPFPQHTPWIYYNWPSKFMEQPDAEKAIKSNKQKKKKMELLLNLGSILGKMVISIVQTVKQKNNTLEEEKDDEMNKVNNKNKEEYEPKAIYGILYPSRGFLEAHMDAHQGWIISISIGATCDFWFTDPKNKNDKRKHHINIQSGDVMVFPGYRLLHGVDNVDKNVPRFWKLLQAKRVIPVQFARYCLQFRHPLK